MSRRYHRLRTEPGPRATHRLGVTELGHFALTNGPDRHSPYPPNTPHAVWTKCPDVRGASRLVAR